MKMKWNFLDMIKIGYLNPSSTPTRTNFNYNWMLFKCFYEDFGKYPDQVEWIEPIYKWNEVSLDDIVDSLKDCDIVLFTNYVWNYKINRKVVDRLGDGIVKIVGGPHQTTEITRIYDHVADPVAPGELFLQFFIDMFLENNIIKERIPFYNNGVRLPYTFGKSNVYKRCGDYVRECYEYFNDNIDYFQQILILYETTRGCPFQCTYCEWGGGTATKILKKSLDVIKDELEFLGTFDNIELDLADANTGMLKERDFQMMRIMQDNGLQVGDSISVLKTLKLKDKIDIIDFMVETEITRRLISISVQSISKKARDIAKRIDLDYDDTITIIDHIKEKWGNLYEKELHIDLELILGMPGSTLEDFYDEFKLFYRLSSNVSESEEGQAWQNFRDGRFPYMILPATESASPAYQRKYGIKTAKVATFFDTNFQFDPAIDKPNLLYENHHYEYDTIIECFSYTFEEYIEMFIMNIYTPILFETFTKEYITFENISVVAKEVWLGVNEIPTFQIYKELIKKIFTSNDIRSLDKFGSGNFDDLLIETALKDVLNSNEKFIRTKLDAIC